MDCQSLKVIINGVSTKQQPDTTIKGSVRSLPKPELRLEFKNLIDANYWLSYLVQEIILEPIYVYLDRLFPSRFVTLESMFCFLPIPKTNFARGFTQSLYSNLKTSCIDMITNITNHEYLVWNPPIKHIRLWQGLRPIQGSTEYIGVVNGNCIPSYVNGFIQKKSFIFIFRETMNSLDYAK